MLPVVTGPILYLCITDAVGAVDNKRGKVLHAAVDGHLLVWPQKMANRESVISIQLV